MIFVLLCGVLAVSDLSYALDTKKEDLFDLIKMYNDTDTDLAKITDDYAHTLEKEYVAYLKNGFYSEEFEDLTYQLKNFRDGSGDEFFKCVTCRAVINILIRMFRGANGELNRPDRNAIVRNFTIDYCTRFNIESKEVCAAAFDLNWPFIDYVISNSVMSSRTACGIMLETSFCKVNQTEYNWSIEIDFDGPQLTGPKSDIPKKGANDLNILHLTDIHYSPLYAAGNLAECGQPVCCRYKSEMPVESSKGAGKWSDYRKCDTPWEMFTDAIEQIQVTHPKIDYVYVTGDIIDHAVWETSQADNLKYIGKVYEYLKMKFGNVPVFPIIGNHEPHPLDLFSPPDVPKELSVTWLYEYLDDCWSVWLPESTKETILKGGYYTVSPRSGFRIISLNNNDCYTRNWWLFYDGSHLSKQLQWLHDTLLAAEEAGENVHILAHVPSGNECWAIWTREFTRIVERYAKTISGIFNGHTHRDEMKVFYSSTEPWKPINIAWNGGSLTSFVNKNPNYRMYQVEPITYQVVEHETWIFNVTEANEHPDRSPNWYKEYTFGKDFDLKDLSPASVDKLLTRFAKNPNILRKYRGFQMTMADPSLKAGCNEKCLMNLICELASSCSERLGRCWELQEILKKSLQEEEAPTLETNN